MAVTADVVSVAVDDPLKALAVERARRRAAEERADDLAKANDALRTSLAELSVRSDLDSFLGIIMRSAAAVFGSTCAEYWCHSVDEPDIAYIALMIVENRLLSSEDIRRLQPEHPGNHGFRVPPEMVHGEPLRHRTRHFLVEHRPGDPYFRDATLMCGPAYTRGINLPVNVGDETVGALVIRMTAEFEVTRQKVELAMALANQAAVAVHMSRMAEAARRTAVEAAVAREKERAALERARMLEDANASLRRINARLADDPGLAVLLGHVLEEACAHVDTGDGAVFLLTPCGRGLRVVGGCVDGRFADTLPGYPFTGGDLLPLEDFEAWSALATVRRPLVLDLEAKQAICPAPTTAEWHRSRGHTHVLVAPMILGDQAVGIIGLAFTRPPAPTPDMLELVNALAQQATLAVELTRLAQDSQTAAVARERELAAEQRAAVLTAANEALRRSTAELTALQSMEGFLHAIAMEAAGLSGAACATVAVAEDDGINFAPVAVVLDGKVAQIGGDPRLNTWRPPYPLSPEDRAVLEQGQRWMCADVDADTRSWDGIADAILDWHRSRGHRTIVRVPIIFGGVLLGYLGLCFRRIHERPDPTWDQCWPLAQHAGLAVRLARMAEQASVNAVLEERNRLAREIHDTLAQGFAAMLMNLRLIARERAALSPRGMRTLDTLETLARENLIEARRSVHALRPRQLEGSHLVDALTRLAEDLGRNRDVRFHLDFQPVQGIPEAVEAELFRIAQEAAANALRHARPRQVSIGLDATDDRGLVMTVADDGAGFDAAGTAGGLGLIGMRERAGRVGARLTVVSEPGLGTEVIVVWRARDAATPNR